MLKLTKTFYKNVDALSSGQYRYIINQGGSSSSKTFSILQIISYLANTHNDLTIDIASESLPHLKRGVLRDLPIVFEQMGLNFDLMLNRSDNFIKFPNAKYPLNQTLQAGSIGTIQPCRSSCQVSSAESSP